MPRPAVRPDRVLRVLLAASVLLFIWLALLICLEKFGVAIPCVFRLATGLYCPGCGATRALAALFRLDIYQALRFNPLLLLFLPYLAVVSLRALSRYTRGQAVRQGRFDFAVSMVFLALAIAFAVARNLPGLAFLAPTALE